MRLWPKRLLYASVAAALLIGGLLMMGNGSDTVSKSVHLKSPANGAPVVASQEASRQSIFGTAALTGSALDVDLKFQRVDAKRKSGTNVSGTGHLTVAGKQYPVQFEGETAIEQTADGKDFYVGGAIGTVVMNGTKVPASLVITGIPDSDKYVITMVLQPDDNTAIALPFGELFAEYKAHFQANRGGN